ncbi:hypothetical protein TGPRC2_426160, partial [Toxoplasma gondii TgCatPRC2]
TKKRNRRKQTNQRESREKALEEGGQRDGNATKTKCPSCLVWRRRGAGNIFQLIACSQVKAVHRMLFSV